MRPPVAVIIQFAAFALSLSSVPSFAQAPPAAPARPAPRIERACPAGANVLLDLSAGEYTITGSPDARIRVWWTTREPGDDAKVYANVEVTGTDARLVASGPRNGFHVTVELPRQANLSVSLTAGKLTVESVEGNLDVSAWAGEMNVGVADPASYYSAYASVTAGEIEAPAFSAKKGGLFRSFEWEGKGPHSVRVRLTAGKVVLYRPSHKG